MRTLLSRMPNDVVSSFSDEQLLHLKIALGARNWGRHKIDFRGTLTLPLVPRQIYYVFLMGKNHRELSRTEQALSALSFALFVSLFLLLSAMGGILVLYLLKSALGINIIEGYSFGVWDWFKELWP
jgi:hypothetical protein